MTSHHSFVNYCSRSKQKSGLPWKRNDLRVIPFCQLEQGYMKSGMHLCFCR
ncbi:hypothetical protein HanXRQr2_Chr08g0349651 [Helianthus annuus]|uniref:Uncharacterized protein n=1 Tax=Helianthus annuus TaxID=4232 RepID=A0A9K3IGN2_HELAN|nr:hypothetical protein HanXRQr2_Chr08g0349651 [Helianthus annuus]